MSKLTIIANIIAKPEHVDFVKSEILKVVEATRAEEGCINYDLHQDNENPSHFMFYEIWETREQWQKHRVNKHILNYKAATENTIESLTVNEMNQIA